MKRIVLIIIMAILILPLTTYSGERTVEIFDFNNQWEALVDKAYSPGGYSSLSGDEKVWFNLQSLIQAIDDGGLISYYYNSGADTLDDCMRALDIVGAIPMKKLLLEVNSLFPDRVPTDIDERNEIIDSWPDDDSIEKFLDPLDEKASSDTANIAMLLVKFIQEKGLSS